MLYLPRFLIPVAAAAVLVAAMPAAQAQFFIFNDPPPRRPPARVPSAPPPAPAPLPPQALISAPFAENATINDIARFLAGLPPVADSPLERVTRDPAWQKHAASFDNSWRQLETQRLSKIRAWSAAHLKDRAGMPMYYMFSGPDFLYADAFYPDASTYILSGLEPVGRIPVVNEFTRGALGNLRASMASSISLSFFITKNMKQQLRESALSGTLPILLVYIARAGKTIDDVTLVTLSPDGTVSPVERSAPQRGAQGVKITFHGGAGKPKQTLYYFSTDVSDSGVRASGFLKFAESFGPGNALFKAASYLPHSGNFTQVRDFILNQAEYVVQDDSGIPVVHFKPEQWTLQPFGRYLGPIAIFPGRFQNRLADLYERGKPKPLDWGMGYRWRTNESNVLLAVRKDAGTRQQLRPAISGTPAVKPPAESAAPAMPVKADIAAPSTTASTPAMPQAVSAEASALPAAQPSDLQAKPVLPDAAAQQPASAQ
ncbi:hypothetical protein [Pseudorhodoplanes sp.]|uniref:hypothetical protein n=1 Tax=Pseudorhodoplanes sp. TaxID=1934341 RepID=UPI00391D082B